MRRRTPARIVAPICLECGATASLVKSQEIYPRRPDLWNRPMWLCRCGAYTSCHDGTQKPKGKPAGPETRRARIEAHAAFDQLWKKKIERDGCSKSKARGAGYEWLAGQLGIAAKDCHIGDMNENMARRVVNICRRY